MDQFFAGYDGLSPTLEFDGTTGSDVSHRYLWGPQIDQLLADEQVTTTGTPGNVLWALADHLGTIRDIADYDEGTPNFALVNHRVYDSFGNLTSETNSSVDLSFAYTGKFLDDQTGLSNHLHRWLDPQLGKWISEDPIGFLGGDANLGRYAGNGPTNSIDPLGLQETQSNELYAQEANVTQQLNAYGMQPSNEMVFLREQMQGNPFLDFDAPLFDGLSFNELFVASPEGQLAIQQLALRKSIAEMVQARMASQPSIASYTPTTRQKVIEYFEGTPGRYYDLVDSENWRISAGITSGSQATALAKLNWKIEAEMARRESVRRLQANRGLMLVPGSALNIWDHGVHLLSIRGVNVPGLRAPSVRARVPRIPTVILGEGHHVLVVMKDGKVIAQSHSSYSHQELINRQLNGVLPKGAVVGTVGKLEGNVIILPSTNFPNNRPKPSDLDAIKKIFE